MKKAVVFSLPPFFKTKKFKMKKIQWLDYLYANCRTELFGVIRSYNMPIPTDMAELYECIDYLIATVGEEAEEKLLKIHPEYDGISKLVQKQPRDFNVVQPLGYHNFAGEDKTSSVVGSSITESDVLKLIEAERRRNIQNVLLISVGILFLFKFFKKEQ